MVEEKEVSEVVISKELSVEDINFLMQDWFVRDGETYVAISAEKKLAWEPSDGAYSTFITGGKTTDYSIRKAYKLLKRYVAAMGFKKPVPVYLSKSEDSFTTGKAIFVSTQVFDDKSVDINEAIDVFLGIGGHEGAHILETDIPLYQNYLKVKSSCEAYLANVLEDERIERKLGSYMPGVVRFLEKTKYYMFDSLYLKRLAERKKTLNNIERILDCFIKIIRYPKYLKTDDVEFFAHKLLEIKKILTPYPDSTEEILLAATKIYDVIKDLIDEVGDDGTTIKMTSDEFLDMLGKGSIKPDADSTSGAKVIIDGGSEEALDKIRDLLKDMKVPEGGKVSDPDGDSSSSVTGGSLPSSETFGSSSKRSKDTGEEAERKEKKLTDSGADLDKAISKMMESTAKTLVEMAESSEYAEKPVYEAKSMLKTTPGELAGIFEIAYGGAYLEVAKKDVESYTETLTDVKRYVPAVKKYLQYRDKNYRLTNKGLRNGHIDISKLSEAVQGVDTIYETYGHVITDKIALCLVIDESGSMNGDSIKKARQCAILLAEAIKDNHSIELFIYGHSADIREHGKVDLIKYYESGERTTNLFSLGSISAKSQNRDGDAILAIAHLVRRRTKRKCLMFVISDGEPCAYGYGGDDAVADTKRKVKLAEALNIDIVQIAINHSYDPKTMFSNSIILDDLSRLPFDLSKFIKQVVSKKLKTHIN
jgi:uncharacterized protein with von Willebrand factor type A (vWA) domain